jgi:hypothetical protein
MEKIYSKQNRKKLLHVISRRNLKEKRIDILDPKLPLQVSRINLKNCIIKPHANVKKYRSFKEKIQCECWIVTRGSISVSLFDIDKTKIKKTSLNTGSVLITIDGGHSIDKTSSYSQLVEIKLGPYIGRDIVYY